jgi:hypothetical protein
MSQKFDAWNWVWELAFASFVIFFFATIGAYLFPNVVDFTPLGKVTYFPYRSYALPLGICTFVFLFIGIVAIGISLNKKPEEQKSLPKEAQSNTFPMVKYCPHCGMALPKANLKYCPFCGKSLKFD